MNVAIPKAVGLKACNYMLGIPTYNGFSPPPSFLKLKGSFTMPPGSGSGPGGSGCNFFTFEFRRRELEKSFDRLGFHNYSVMSSFREPLSHFISSYEHQEREMGYRHSLNETVDSLLLPTPKSFYYDLRNFQSHSYVGNSDKKPDLFDVLQYMYTLFWFSILEDYRLSLALLQCQLHGYVNSGLLDLATEKKHNTAVSLTKPHLHEYDAETLRKVKKLISWDTFLYNQAVQEFYRRVERHKNCLESELQRKKDDIQQDPYVSSLDHFQPFVGMT